MSQMLDGERMSIKTEDGFSSVGIETSAPHIPYWAVVVKVENDVTAEEQTNEPGNSANFFEIEIDQTRGIKTERVDENSFSEEHELSYASTSTAAESNILIKKEEDIETGDEVRETVIESDFWLSIKEEQHFEYDETKSTTFYDPANASSVWGLCEADRTVNPSIVGEDKRICESKRSRAYYYSNGFKLAHVSVILEDLKYHPSVDIVEKRFSCAHCPAKFTCKSTLKNHLKIHTNKNPFLCTFCPAKFKYRNTLKIHVTTHTGEKPFSCAVCSAKFRLKCHLKDHLTTHTGEKSFSCKLCGAKFSRRGNLKSHLATHAGEKLFLCKFCPAKFRHRNSLKYHLTSHTGEKQFLCRVCPAKFSQICNLKNHLRIHTKEKPFLCTICPAKFCQKGDLKNHLMIHTGEKPFSCTICPAKFNRKCNLKTHLISHSAGNPFLCKICPAKFRHSNTLKNHLTTHTGEKLFLCTLCPAKYRLKQSLKKHLRTHTNEKYFSSADVFESETDQIREMNTERVDVNLTENPSSEESVRFYRGSSDAAENCSLIKKEEDIDLEDEVSQAVSESNYRPPYEG